jgi:hypothetical protein
MGPCLEVVAVVGLVCSLLNVTPLGSASQVELRVDLWNENYTCISFVFVYPQFFRSR